MIQNSFFVAVEVTFSSRGNSFVSFKANLTTLPRTSSGIRFQTCFGLGERSFSPASPCCRYRSYPVDRQVIGTITERGLSCFFEQPDFERLLSHHFLRIPGFTCCRCACGIARQPTASYLSPLAICSKRPVICPHGGTAPQCYLRHAVHQYNPDLLLRKILLRNARLTSLTILSPGLLRVPAVCLTLHASVVTMSKKTLTYQITLFETINDDGRQCY